MKKSQTSHRLSILLYVSIPVSAGLSFYFLSDSSFSIGKELHPALEGISAAIAFFAGISLLARHYARKDTLLLFIGLAFLGGSFLNALESWRASSIASDEAFSPWHGLASQVFLSLMLFSATAFRKREASLGPAAKLSDYTVYVIAAALLFSVGWLLAMLPMPRDNYLAPIVSRPTEFLPGFIFAIALARFLLDRFWKTDSFEHWLIVSLILNTLSQTLFLPFSATSQDIAFTLGSICQSLADFALLAGLFLSTSDDREKLIQHASSSRKSDQPDDANAPIESRLAMGTRFKLFFALGLALVTSASLISGFIYARHLQLTAEQAISAQKAKAEAFHTGLDAKFNELREDAVSIAQLHPIKDYAIAMLQESTPKISLDLLSVRVEKTLKRALEQRPESNQIHLVRMDRSVQELVKVIRTDHHIKSADSEQLLKYSDAQLLEIAQALDPTQAAVIRPILSHGETKEMSELKTIAPVFDSDGELFGAIVVYRHFESILKTLTQSTDEYNSVRVADQWGHYIFDPSKSHHDDPNAAPVRLVVHEFPEIQDRLDIYSNIELSKTVDRSGRLRSLVSFKIPLASDIDQRFLLALYTWDHDHVLADTRIGPTEIILAALMLVTLALIMAWAFFSFFRNPTRYLAYASIKIEHDGSQDPLPPKEGVMPPALQNMRSKTDSRSEEGDALSPDFPSQQLEQSLEKARAESKAKSEFIDRMSREIRNPINGIMGVTECLSNANLSDHDKVYVESIETSGKSILKLTSDMLEFASIDVAKAKLEITSFDLANQIAAALKTAIPSAEEREIQLVISVAPDIPPTISADRELLKKILINLVGNALKFTRRGTVTVNVRRVDSSDLLQFDIVDTGVGIPQAHHQRIFDAFYQVNPSNSYRLNGSGFGLAIAAKLANTLGGEIWVQSKPDEGSTFSFTIDARANAQDKEPRQASLDTDLVVIINPNLREAKAIADQLSTRNIDIEIISDFKEAEKIFCLSRPIGLIIANRAPECKEFVEECLEAARDEINANIYVLNILYHNQSQEKIYSTKKANIYRPFTAAQICEKVERLAQKRKRPESTGERLNKEPISADFAESNPLRILVVDDNEINLFFLIELLKSLGYSVDKAIDGEEAVEQYRKRPYDIIFMDISMPKMSGLEATRLIREPTEPARPKPLIIATTANALEYDKESCFAAGMDDYLCKPLRIEYVRGCLVRAAKLVKYRERISASIGKSPVA